MSGLEQIFNKLNRGPLKDKIQVRYFSNTTARIETIDKCKPIVDQNSDGTYDIMWSHWCDILGIEYTDVFEKVPDCSSLKLTILIKLIKVYNDRKDVEL